MFGNLKGLGDIGSVMKAAMSGDKSGLIGMLKPHLPAILQQTVRGIITAAGGDPATDGAFLWHHTRADGSETVMAMVYRRDTMGDPAELVATIDVLRTLENTDLTQYIQ